MKESNAFLPLFCALSFAIAGILNIYSFDDGSSIAVYWVLFLSILRFIRLYLVDYRGVTSFFFDCFLENNNYSCIFAPDNNYK